MSSRPPQPSPDAPNLRVLLAYVADLELEVDRLRKQGRFVQKDVRNGIQQIRDHCAATQPAGGSGFREIDEVASNLAAMLRDMQDNPGYHPAHDQVVAIAMRPLFEQVFRTQSRLEGATHVELRLELESEYVEWFPARLRHLFDNLFSNSLKYRDPDKDPSWISVGLRVEATTYEFRVSDNGRGLPQGRPGAILELFYRAAPARAAGLGVGLAVVRLLVEQSAGTLTVDSSEGHGTAFVLNLPRYELADFLI